MRDEIRTACEEWLRTHIKTVDMLPHDVDALLAFATQQRAAVWREAATHIRTGWIDAWGQPIPTAGAVADSLEQHASEME